MRAGAGPTRTHKEYKILGVILNLADLCSACQINHVTTHTNMTGNLRCLLTRGHTLAKRAHVSFVHHATPGTVLLAAPKLRPQKHLSLRPEVGVSTGEPKVWSWVVIVRSNCSLDQAG
jgi:hypothetical protein